MNKIIVLPLQSQLTNWEKEINYLMAKKQEAEKELKAKEAELDTVTVTG
ncbi:MAG: small subunit ribosomal protein, partial [Mucilaginibacter sp.]|nr:small subunit ribosomal protein [Mucilaginibacter sp.]